MGNRVEAPEFVESVAAGSGLNKAAPASAYIHVPFCRHRCGYCNFTLVAGRDDLMEAYLAALARELHSLAEPRPVETLFLGGGTPTHLPPALLDRLLTLARHWFPLHTGAEFSVEANPADLTAERADVLAAHGVTRISLGAQSFHAEKLRVLERDHGPDDIAAAVAQARRFAQSVSLDLIFAAPGESLDGWQADLAATLALGPDHLSTYGLTFEKGTSFWPRLLRGELARADEEDERAMYLAAIDTLTGAGFEHYEVSNFARAGHRCRHNEAYWLGRSYFAAGPGAARFLDGRREKNHASVTTWIRRLLAGESPVAESETISPELHTRERVVFGLRRLAGIDLTEIHAATGIDPAGLLAAPLEKYVALGLLARDGPRVRLTREGLLVSDAMWGDFLVG